MNCNWLEELIGLLSNYFLSSKHLKQTTGYHEGTIDILNSILHHRTLLKVILTCKTLNLLQYILTCKH